LERETEKRGREEGRRKGKIKGNGEEKVDGDGVGLRTD